MSAQKMVSERDAVLRERRAWERGMRRGFMASQSPFSSEAAWPGADYLPLEAANEYPLPKKTVPRVVEDSLGVEWRSVDGELQWRRERDAGWQPARNCSVLIARGHVILWANLLENPTEEVEDDGGAA